jgi:hypothetical protein
MRPGPAKIYPELYRRRQIMKKAIVVLAIVFLSSMAAQAQTGGGMSGEERAGRAGNDDE